MTPVYDTSAPMDGGCTFKDNSEDTTADSSGSSKSKLEKTTSIGSRSWSEFTQDTTMHGIRYVSEAESPKATRSVCLINVVSGSS